MLNTGGPAWRFLPGLNDLGYSEGSYLLVAAKATEWIVSQLVQMNFCSDWHQARDLGFEVSRIPVAAAGINTNLHEYTLVVH